MVLSCLICGCGRIGFAPEDHGALTLSYPTHAIYAVVNASTIAVAPTVSDTAARFTIDPALPAALYFDPETGAIRGTPVTTVEQTYTVTARTAGAAATATFSLTALPGYIVDTTADAADANDGGDAICATAAGPCSLRAAIQTTNHLAAKQLVLLESATYRLGAALDPIANDVVIAGQGAGASVIRATTAHGGYAALALASNHLLALRDLAIDDFGGADGGALGVTAGTLDVDRCTFTNNASPTSGGVLFINGGAHAQLANSTFTGNASLGGNGGGWGGVIDGEDAGTEIVVTTSTATENTTAWGSFSHITTGTTLRLENSTLYGNTSTTAGTLATPGGIYTLVNDTIVGNVNTTTDSAGIYLFSAPCHYTITNTIVAFNRDSAGEHDCNRRDLTTTIDSGGGNILGDAGANCAAYFTAPGDRLMTDPGLVSGAPADNGGATATLLLAADSVAIDTAGAAACPATDQRGLPRPVGVGCDVGAIEMQ